MHGLLLVSFARFAHFKLYIKHLNFISLLNTTWNWTCVFTRNDGDFYHCEDAYCLSQQTYLRYIIIHGMISFFFLKTPSIYDGFHLEYSFGLTCLVAFNWDGKKMINFFLPYRRMYIFGTPKGLLWLTRQNNFCLKRFQNVLHEWIYTITRSVWNAFPFFLITF